MKLNLFEEVLNIIKSQLKYYRKYIMKKLKKILYIYASHSSCESNIYPAHYMIPINLS